MPGAEVDMGRISIIVPTLNEAGIIEERLKYLLPLRRKGHEVIVADGGSSDGTPDLALPLADALIQAPRGRATQMNAGAGQAHGDILLFLHADTRLPDKADELIMHGLAESGLAWGRFDVLIEGESPWFKAIAWSMNHRSRLTGIATGDQALFVKKETFTRIGGFPDIALMEDIAISARLKSTGKPLCLPQQVITSGRRWQKHGILRTIFKMWRLRLAYFLRADPNDLARQYGYEPREN